MQTPEQIQNIAALVDEARACAVQLQKSIGGLRLRVREIRGLDLSQDTGDPVGDLTLGQLRIEAAIEGLALAGARLVEARAHLAVAYGALR